MSGSPSDDELRLLAVGDVHLGMRPSRLPKVLESVGIDPRELTPEAALGTVVDLAIEERVDAVLFAGDVVEGTNALYEALRPLEVAVRRLHEASIPVLAVVGNHDVEALPRLAGMIEGLRLLGQPGHWESHLREKARGAAVEILGWSFPQRRVKESPVAGLLRDPIPAQRPETPRIGLLHADLDASGGVYAPVSSADLRAATLDAWLLGHVHKPSLSTRLESGGPPPIGYLGSLVGLDPGEPGPHGPWLVRVTPGGDVLTRQLPVTPIRWERLDLRVAEHEGPEEVGDRIIDEATRLTRAIQQDDGPPRVLGLRPRLVGPTRRYEALRRQIDVGGWDGELTRSVGETFFFVDRVIDGLELAHDMEALARGDDPPALLARKLQILEHECEERSLLIEAAREEVKNFARDARWSDLDDPERRDRRDVLSDEAIAHLLRRAGRVALSKLLDQGDAHAGGGFSGGGQ